MRRCVRRAFRTHARCSSNASNSQDRSPLRRLIGRKWLPAQSRPIRPRRFVPLLLFPRIAHQLAQVLAVGLRMLGQQFRQRRVAIGDEPFAPGLHAMQLRGFAP